MMEVGIRGQQSNHNLRHGHPSPLSKFQFKSTSHLIQLPNASGKQLLRAQVSAAHRISMNFQLWTDPALVAGSI